MIKRTRSVPSKEFRNRAIAFFVCGGLLAAGPPLMRGCGVRVVVAAPFVVLFSLIVRGRSPRGWWLRPAFAGLAAGFAGVFAYAFSPPVLERIGHELGWPGQSLRHWERFTQPVYEGPCTDPRFWKVFEIWDTWVRMLSRSSLVFAVLTLMLITAIAFVVRALRRKSPQSVFETRER